MDLATNVLIVEPLVDVHKFMKHPRGFLHIYTGDGKGKTTAALGLLLRAIGAQKHVAVVFFDKGGKHYCERKTIENFLNDSVDFFVTGRDRRNSQTGLFDFSIIEEDKQEAKKGLAKAKQLLEEGYHDLVILDELNSTVHLGMLDEKEVLSIIALRPLAMELVLTGRHAPDSFLSKADLITRMQYEKHYFYSGVYAREGIDF